MSSRRLARLGPPDRWIAAGFVLAAAVEALARYHAQPVQLAINLPGSALWAALGWRRSRPLLAVAVIAVGGVAGSLAQAGLVPNASTNSDVAIIALVVASYSLGAHASRRDLLLGAPLPVLVILATDLLQPSDQPLARALPFAVCFVVLAPIAGGRLVRARTALVDRLRAQNAELAAHRGEQVEAELARERLRLSEQVHADLLAGMRALSEQAAAAVSDARRDDPGTVAAIEQAARALLTRTRQAVVALTSPPSPTVAETGVGAWEESRAAAQPWTALAAAAQCAGLIAELHALPLHVPLPVAVLACVPLVAPLALVWTRPLPMTALLWVFAALFGTYVATLTSSTAAIGLAFAAPFAVAALSRRRTALLGFVVCAAGDAVVYGRTGVGAALVLSAASWLAGLVLRERSRLADELRRNAGRFAAQRAALAQRAVLVERARVARDLHDAVGHSLTIVALQAGAARRMWITDPTRAAAALRTVADVARDGLAELRSSPRPAEVGSLDALLAGARSAGLDIDAQVDDGALDGAVGEVLYRAVQESLTNVLKHAPAAAVRLTIRRTGDRVELTVTNTRGRPSGSGAGTGRGLPGMQSRVAALGGRVEWGPRPDGGFGVRAVLPLAELAVAVP